MPEIAISVIINGHREGLVAAPSLRSLDTSVARARADGLSVEILAVLDRPDPLTRSVFSDWASEDETVCSYIVDHGDLGLSRNFGVSRSKGRFIAFLDADDLWSANWLTDAYFAAEAEPRLSVWHPETNIYFGSRSLIYMHVDMDDPAFDLAYLVERNPWTALSFTRRELLIRVPYGPTVLSRQIGFEDWSWNIETVLHGAVHKTVVGTAHAIRSKPSSLLGSTLAANCMPRPTPLFRSMLAERRKLTP